jgi:pyruvate kinase
MTLYNTLQVIKARGLVDRDDIVVVTAGDAQTSPRQGDYTTSTNMAMVAQIQ